MKRDHMMGSHERLSPLGPPLSAAPVAAAPAAATPAGLVCGHLLRHGARPD